MTINKAQGQTLQKVGLDLQDHVFAHGQLYVASNRTTKCYNLELLVVPHRLIDGVLHVVNVAGSLLTVAAKGAAPPAFPTKYSRINNFNNTHYPDSTTANRRNNHYSSSHTHNSSQYNHKDFFIHFQFIYSMKLQAMARYK